MPPARTRAHRGDETDGSPEKLGCNRHRPVQSTTHANGKKERWFGTLKRECIRPGTPLSLEDARRLVARFVEHYNTVRLHSAIGYVAPADKLLGLEPVIHAERDRKLDEARQLRRQKRQAARGNHDPPSKPAGSTNSKHGQHRPLDIAALRRQVSIEEVLKHLGYFDPLRGSGRQRRGPCPLHDAPSDRHRSFSVHLDKGVFRCFHPECQAQGNTLDLWAAYHRLPIGQAAESLARTFAQDLTSPEKPVTEKTAMGKLHDKYKCVPPSNRRQAAFEKTRVGSNGKAKVFSLSRWRHLIAILVHERSGPQTAVSDVG
jgi:hypothetical protein